MDDREQEQRERAYRIWEEEGRPEGLHEDHWKRAGEQPDFDDLNPRPDQSAGQERGNAGDGGKKRAPANLEATLANPK